MAHSRLIILLAVSVTCIVQNVSCNQVPVLTWGNLSRRSMNSNPLSKLSTIEFNSLVKQEIEDARYAVIFMENTLSVEDFSHKNREGKSSFPYFLSIIGKAVYLPAVESPMLALNELADPEKVDHVKLTDNGLSAVIETKSDKFMVIDLEDAKEGETRAQLLRRHNDFMQDMYEKLAEQYGSVVAIYTARYPSWIVSESHSRVRRDTRSSDVLYSFENLLLYVGSLELKSDNDTISLSQPKSQTDVLNGTELEATLEFEKQKVSMKFVLSAGYWYFNTVSITDVATGVVEELNVVSDTADGVYALEDFAYRCGSGASFATVNETKSYTLTFNNIKVQPFFAANGSVVFAEDSFNCSGFFSIPIWSGLFVTFIMLAITFYGIMMMMDIKTMDRFDDPKGKTIAVSATEG